MQEVDVVEQLDGGTIRGSIERVLQLGEKFIIDTCNGGAGRKPKIFVLAENGGWHIMRVQQIEIVILKRVALVIFACSELRV